MKKLPATLDETPFLRKLSAGPFGIDRINYMIMGTNYRIDSYCVPLGPHPIYSSKKREWDYEE